MVFYYILNMMKVKEFEFDLMPTILRQKLERKKDEEHHREIYKRDLAWMNDITKFYKLLQVYNAHEGLVKFEPWNAEAELLKKFATKRMNNRKVVEPCCNWSKTMWQINDCSNICTLACITSAKYHSSIVYTKICIR